MTAGRSPVKLTTTMSEEDTPKDDEPRGEGRADVGAGSPIELPRRFKRDDGRFDLPVVAGRTPKQVARRLA